MCPAHILNLELHHSDISVQRPKFKSRAQQNQEISHLVLRTKHRLGCVIPNLSYNSQI